MALVKARRASPTESRLCPRSELSKYGAGLFGKLLLSPLDALLAAQENVLKNC